MSLTHKQAEVLRFIVAYQAANGGASPSYKEIGDGVGVKSKCCVYNHTIALQERGFIHMIPNRPRCITVLKLPDQGLPPQPASPATNICPHCCEVINIPLRGKVS